MDDSVAMTFFRAYPSLFIEILFRLSILHLVGAREVCSYFADTIDYSNEFYKRFIGEYPKDMRINLETIDVVFFITTRPCWSEEMKQNAVTRKIIPKFGDALLEAATSCRHLSPFRVQSALYLIRSGTFSPCVYQLEAAIWKGNVTLVNALLEHPGIDVTFDENKALRRAANLGYTEIFKRILKEKGVDASAKGNKAIKYAALNGYAEIMTILLQTPGVDPTVDLNYPIRSACEFGHDDVVRLLLADSRADPSAEDNQPIRLASKNGHVAIVKMLIGDERVDPGDIQNEALRNAIFNGHLEVVRCLMQTQEVMARFEFEHMTHLLILRHNLEIIKFLVEEVPGVDVTAENHLIANTAAICGTMDILDYLLTRPGVDINVISLETIKELALKARYDNLEFICCRPEFDRDRLREAGESSRILRCTWKLFFSEDALDARQPNRKRKRSLRSEMNRLLEEDNDWPPTERTALLTQGRG